MEPLNNNKQTSLNVGMIKDLDPQLLKEGQYTHAINSQLNSHEGNYSFLQNEPGNKLCLTLPDKLKFIGAIALLKSRFAIFSTDNTNSEIGIFDSTSCTYTKVVNDPCLGFNTNHLIKGVSKENTDCSESIYWANDFDPNRFLNLSDVPYKYTFADDTCKTKVYTTDLDCDQLLIDQLIAVPCLSIKKSNAGGTLPNGAYQAVIAYSIDGELVTDYYSVTSPQALFTHDNTGEAVDIELSNLDTDFQEFQLFIIATIAQQTTVYQIGSYPTTSKSITVSSILESTTVPLSNLFLQKIVYTNSKDVLTVDNRLLWVGANTKEELDYQKAATQVTAKWVAYAVPADYYKNGGTIVGYMGDETYPFGIQWLYNTGDYSSVFPFVGRAATTTDRSKIVNKDAYELFAKNCEPVAAVERWQAYNTASGTIAALPASDCKEFVIGTGAMAYDESTELYPDNISSYGDLACTPIRHFRFPDECIVPKKVNGNNNTMIILGIQFENITHPVDSNGNPLTNIVGYRIVRGDRTNNKRILGKGILFNMGEYDLPVSQSSTIKAMYPNAPFNDLRIDPYLSKKQVKGGTKEGGYEPMGTYSKTHFTFHSPSMTFDKPSLGTELNIGIELSGKTITNFVEPFGHPKHKILSDVAFIVASCMGIAEGIFATQENECVSLVVKNLNPGMVGVTNGIGNPAISAAIVAFKLAKDRIKELNLPYVPRKAALKAARQAYETAVNAALLVPGAAGESTYSEEHCKKALDVLPTLLRALNNVYLFSFYFQQGFQTALDAINNFAAFEQYAFQVNSHCLYDNYVCPKQGNKRRYIESASYLYPAVQQFEGIQINNFKRESSVIIKLNDEIQNPTVIDTSRETLNTGKAWTNLSYEATASSYYGAIKQKLPGQYGQLNSIKWLNTANCNPIVTRLRTYSSGPIFGGDTYINRFSQKRKLHYFNQTEFQENNGHEFDYRKYYNLPYARYWMNTVKYDLSSLISLTNPQLPNDLHNFDKKKTKNRTQKIQSPFILRDQAFYLSNNSVIEYFVESEYNLDYRDWEEQPFFRHYDRDRYSDVSTLLRSDYLDYDNRYLYDKSLSKQLTEGYFQVQYPNFDPQIAATCYKTFPNKVYWSLPYFKGPSKDSWGFNLVNNNFDFPASNGRLTSAKAIDRTTILFFFEDSGPWIHQAQDTLELDSGLKVTLGDSGLFGRPPVPLVNTDIKYGNCQSKFAFTNTQYGLFYPSLRQGRVFQVMGTQLKDISMDGINWWLKANMPYKLTIDFGEHGLKKTSAQITKLYKPNDLIGRQVIAVVNFPPKQIANIMSECLILGGLGENKEVTLIQPDSAIKNGTRIG